MGEALASCERPAGELLQACQALADLATVQRAAGKLNAKMVGDGRASLWVGGGEGGGWCATMSDAIGDGVTALALWRSGQTLRRGDDGADVVTLDDGGGVSFAWQVESWPDGDGQPVRRSRYVATGSRLAWRSLVDSVARDTFGETTAAAAGDWWEWYSAPSDRHGLRRELRARRRLSQVEQVRDSLAAGRGRRAALADKVKQAAVLMLSGMSADEAAAAAGFKSSEGGKGGGGRVKAGDRLAAALRRAGRRVTFKRGAWAEPLDEFTAAARRGAAADLATLFPGLPSLPVDGEGKPVFTGAVAMLPPEASTAAAVIGSHPLDKAASGRGEAAAAGVDASSLPASSGQLRRVVRAAARRGLRGVVKARGGRRAAAVADDTSRAAVLSASEHEGAEWVARLAAARAVAVTSKPSGAAVWAADGPSGSVRVARCFLVGADGVAHAGTTQLRKLWRGVTLRLVGQAV